VWNFVILCTPHGIERGTGVVFSFCHGGESGCSERTGREVREQKRFQKSIERKKKGALVSVANPRYPAKNR